MKNCKLKLVLGVIIALVMTCGLGKTASAASGDVNISAKNFPDQLFREYVKSFDNNKDGILSQKEREAVKSIVKKYVSFDEGAIYSVKGIEYFPNLTTINLSSNCINSLDLSNQTKLEELNIDHNGVQDLKLNCSNTLKKLSCVSSNFTALDISGYTVLERLNCEYNTKLKSLNVKDCKGLGWINCYNCPLTKLDVSTNPNLQILKCYSTNLTSLDVSNNKKLKYLYCYSIDLTKLDVSKCPELKELYTSYTKLEKLDLSHNKELTWLSIVQCEQLKELDLSNNTKLGILSCSENKQLSKVVLNSDYLYDCSLERNPSLKEVDLSKCERLRKAYNTGDVAHPNAGISKFAKEWDGIGGHAELTIDTSCKVINNVVITVELNDAAGGTVDGMGIYSTGDKVNLIAKANAKDGFYFNAFKIMELNQYGREVEGEILSESTRYSFVAKEDLKLRAEFLYSLENELQIKVHGERIEYGTEFEMIVSPLEGQSEVKNITYQWYRGDTPISGAQDKIYKAQKEDVGSVISCLVKNKIGEKRRVYLAQAVMKKKITESLSGRLKGIAPERKGTKSGSIQGTTDQMEYSLSSDFKQSFPCSNTQTKGLGAGTYYVRVKETAISEAGPSVKITLPEGPNDLKASVTISGSAKCGQTLKVVVKDTNNTGKLSYQWKRNGKAISNATQSSYKLVKEDLGATISCDVKSSVEWGNITAKLSAKVEKADSPAAPDGISIKAPSRYGWEDGEIRGLSKNMEYATKKDFSNAKTCTESNMSVKAGTYYIRYKETETRKAGVVYKVVVPNGPTATETFTDVKQGAWYEEAVKYVYVKGIMNGISAKRFAPEENMSRAQFVVTLHNFAGRPQVTKQAGFKDVPKGVWYEQAVNWASSIGITSGVSKNMFGSEQMITRQQAAVMFYKYATLVKWNTKSKSTALDKFQDKNQVASWAEKAMQWAVYQGVINGKQKNKAVMLAPNDVITRAECAQMIKNIVDHVK